jgi:hypothetical protein
VVFQNEKVVQLVAHRVGRIITNDDIRELLKANSDIHGWMEDEHAPRWLRRDRKVDAFREKRHEDMFFVRDIAVAEKSGINTIPGSR